MAFFKWLGGKTAAEHEKRADEFAAEAAWGKAKLEYEKALDKLESQPEQPEADSERLHDKIRQNSLALADQHLHNGRELMEAGYPEDAAELFELALELSANSPARERIATLLQQARPAADAFSTAGDEAAHEPVEPFPTEDLTDDYFLVLCSMLPDELQEVYSQYGPAFREGYVALNQGEFQKAAECLDQALQSRPDDGGYILLELAGAYFNLGRIDEARRLAEKFIQRHPEALPGYELLCEIYWEQKDFGSARGLLKNCPRPLHATVAYVVLYGETLRREAEYGQALDWFNDHMQRHGWNDKIALALAAVYEQSGQAEQALNLYSRYMGNCRGCGSTTPPEIERKYADLSLAGGNFSDEILEIYLALARKDPAHAADYYFKVSRIYTHRGNQTEALRFESIAETGSQEAGLLNAPI